jgi:hypothetical protein
MYIFPTLRCGEETFYTKMIFLSQYVKDIIQLIVISIRYANIEKLSKATNLLRWLLQRGSPLPIPNREVKPACADGTAVMWESMTPPFF